MPKKAKGTVAVSRCNHFEFQNPKLSAYKFVPFEDNPTNACKYSRIHIILT